MSIICIIIFGPLLSIEKLQKATALCRCPITMLTLFRREYIFYFCLYKTFLDTTSDYRISFKYLGYSLQLIKVFSLLFFKAIVFGVTFRSIHLITGLSILLWILLGLCRITYTLWSKLKSFLSAKHTYIKIIENNYILSLGNQP